jgi:hypothetical protein
LHPFFVQDVEIGINGQLRVKDELFGIVASALFPELDELQDFICLLLFADGGIGVAEVLLRGSSQL